MQDFIIKETAHVSRLISGPARLCIADVYPSYSTTQSLKKMVVWPL